MGNKLVGLYVGRGGYWTKGLDRVIKFSKEIYKLYPDYKLTIIGSDKNKVEHLLDEPFIDFKGVVKRNKIKSYYEKANIFFCFSRYEGGSPNLATGEALANGVDYFLYTEDGTQGEILEELPFSMKIKDFSKQEAKNLLREITNKEIKPEISVLTTVYNGEKYIKEMIESVLSQSFKDFEHIIIDDGSTDKTREIIESFKDERIRYIYAGKNKGFFEIHKVINLGLNLCKGKYIARIDADDLMHHDRLEIQYNYLEKNKNIFMIGSSVSLIDMKGNVIGHIFKKSYPSFLYKYRLGYSNPFIHSSMIFRNEGYLYPSYNEHMFYVWLASKGKKLKNISNVVGSYRINDNGAVSKYAKINKGWMDNGN